MGYNLLINAVYWGYNPLTCHLLTSWDIQVDKGRKPLPKDLTPKFQMLGYQHFKIPTLKIWWIRAVHQWCVDKSVHSDVAMMWLLQLPVWRVAQSQAWFLKDLFLRKKKAQSSWIPTPFFDSGKSFPVGSFQMTGFITGCLGLEDFVDVPDAVTEVRCAQRRDDEVLLRWKRPRDNARAITQGSSGWRKESCSYDIPSLKLT